MNLNLHKIISYDRLLSVIGFLAFFTIALSSCKKSKNNFNECLCGSEICTELDDLDENFYISPEPFDIISACFNPNSDTELVYSVVNYGEGTRGVFKYNLTSGISVELFSGPIIFQVEWGVNDWILFNTEGGVVHKIKSDGSGHQILNDAEPYYYPNWSHTGDSIFTRMGNGVNTAVLNTNGDVLDTVDGTYSTTTNAYNHPQFIASTSLGNLVLKSIEQDSTHVLYSLDDDYNTYSECFYSEHMVPRGTVWVNDDIYYSNNLGVFKSDISGSSSKLIKRICNNHGYFEPSVNMSKTKLLFVKKVSEVIENGTILSYTKSLVTMNLDGTGEVEVLE